MSSLDETKSGIPYPLTAFARRHALYRLLALLAAGLLMIWVSGGLMAQPMQLLLQACAHFSQLRAARGMEFLLSFALLLVQSLLLVAAWVLYLWIVLREFRSEIAHRAGPDVEAAATVIVETPPTPEMAPASSGGAVSASAAEPMVEYPAQDWRNVKAQVSLNPFEDDVAAMETLIWSLPTTVEEPTVRKAPPPAASLDVRAAEVRVVSPAKSEQELPSVQERSERGSSALKKMKLRRNQIVEAKGDTAGSSESQAEKEEKQPATQLVPYVPQASGEMEALNPFYEPEAGAEVVHFSSILREMGFFQIEQQEEEKREAQGVSREGRTQRERKEEGEQTERRAEVTEAKEAAPEANPFGVHADILELFAPARPAEEEKRASPAPVPAELPPDQLYVYGNPFEGPLPDIFEHDESLKNSVLEQVAEELEGRQTGGRLKGAGKHTPGEQERTVKRSPRRKNQERS